MSHRKELQIDLPNQEGDTPLHLACEDEQVAIKIIAQIIIKCVITFEI